MRLSYHLPSPPPLPWPLLPHLQQEDVGELCPLELSSVLKLAEAELEAGRHLTLTEELW